MPQTRRIAVMLEVWYPFKRHADTYAGVQEYAQEHGWKTVIDEFAGDSLAKVNRKSLPYDGVIARASQTLAQHAGRLRLPAVNVWLNSPVVDRLPGVFSDYRASGRLQAEHLLARGLRNFVAFGYHRDQGSVLEVEGIHRTLRAAGYECPVHLMEVDYHLTPASFRKAEQIIQRALDAARLPLGVFACAEPFGRMITQICEARGLRVPGDVAVIAGWNEDVLCNSPSPSLSSMEFGYRRVGYEAARMLDGLIDLQQAGGRRRHSTTKPEHRWIPPSGLVVRESTDFHASEDPLVAAALDFIAANSHRPIMAKDVARAAVAEERTLRRRFQKALGRSIAAEVRRVRIERAKRELVQTNDSMAEVAKRVGFETGLRLYQVFQREIGVAPTEYREQQQARGYEKV
jgi:LacI family transcriptional regulator